MSERTPELIEVMRRAIEAGMLELHTAMPARVTRLYTDASGNLVAVDAKPLIKIAARNEEDERVAESLPVIPRVPVLFQGGGGYRLTFPVQAGENGTKVLLIFAEASLDKWLSGTGAEVDPEVDHRGALMDAVAIPELHPFGRPLASAPTDHATLGADSGVQIHLRDQTITVGDESGSQFVALSEKVQNYLTALSSAINGWIPVPTDGGAALKTALSSAGIIGGTWGTDVAATQAKAK